MQDVDSSFGALFYFLMILPIIMLLLGRLFARMPQSSAPVSPRPKTQAKKSWGEPPSISVSLSFPNMKTTSTKSKKSKKTASSNAAPKKAVPKRTAPKRTAPKKAKPAPLKKVAVSKKAPEMGTDKEIISDVVAGLANLGIKKSQAKQLVQSVCQKKTYTSSELLISDCFMCIKKT